MPVQPILIYVEDPGAANMVLGLASAMRNQGLIAHLYAGGAALDYLTARGEALTPLPSADPAALISQINPVACVIGTAENLDTPGFSLAEAARRRSIPTAALIDGPANADRRFQGRTTDPRCHVTDWLLVPDLGTRSAFLALGIEPARIRVVGNPSHDRVLDSCDELLAQDRATLRRGLFPGLPEDAPLILFLTELSDGLDPTQFRRSADYTLQGRGETNGRTEIVLEEVLDALADIAPAARVALRLHPKTPANLYAAYDQDIAAYSEGGDPHAALFAADLVIGLSTALLTEAVVMGRPTLSVLPREREAEWLIGGDLVPHVSTRDDLRAMLTRALDAPESFLAEQSGGTLRLGASPRTARALAQIAEGGTPAPDGTLPYAPPTLTSERLILEPFPADLLTERYVGWLNDPEVVRFSEQRHRAHTLDSCRDFIATFDGTANGLWAIRVKSDDLRHIGNISTEIDATTGTGDIRILIGDRAAWGTGMGAEAWNAVMAHLFDDLGMAMVTAGTLAGNTGMRRIMEKSGMRETHRHPGPTPVDGQAMDLVFAARSARDWLAGR